MNQPSVPPTSPMDTNDDDNNNNNNNNNQQDEDNKQQVDLTHSPTPPPMSEYDWDSPGEFKRFTQDHAKLMPQRLKANIVQATGIYSLCINLK